jgi:hypothetical protein
VDELLDDPELERLHRYLKVMQLSGPLHNPSICVRRGLGLQGQWEVRVCVCVWGGGGLKGRRQRCVRAVNLQVQGSGGPDVDVDELLHDPELERLHRFVV